jgi:hypothetical protein
MAQTIITAAHNRRLKMAEAQMSGELKAMAQVEAALGALGEEERSRVLLWAGSKFDVTLSPVRRKDKPDGGTEETEEAEDDEREYEDFATFYDAARPKTDTDKALVAAYWLQVEEGQSEVNAQTANTSLKNLGHGVGQITRAFDGLKSQKPALVVQTKKEGSSQQARKKFKVTSEGRKAVERMLAAK